MTLDIRKQRDNRKLSQYKMAHFLHISQHLLSSWETAKTIPSQEDLSKIKKFFIKFDEDFKLGKVDLGKKVVPRTFGLSRIQKIKSLSYVIPSKTNKEARNNGYGPKAIALFAGIGGLSLGFENAGYNVVGHVELENKLEAIYKENFPNSILLGNDVKKVDNSDIEAWKQKFGEIDVLFGGPPCQGFSLAGKRDKNDPRNQLFNEFARIASVLKPKVVLLENVGLLLSMKAPDGSYVRDHLLKAFDKASYRMEFRSVNAKDYGVPQFRERVLFIGVRKDLGDFKIGFPKTTHGPSLKGVIPGFSLKDYVTFAEATKDLERLESGESSKKDPWHFAILHPDHVIRMLKDVPEGKSAHDNVDKKLRPTSGFNTTYKRLRLDEPSSTIGTNFSMISGSRNVHPIDTRSLTIREAMRCQTFPDDYILVGKLGSIRKGIGNAVPPNLAKVFAEHLKSFLKPTHSMNVVKVPSLEVEL